jgi:hypothetical protein
MLLHWKILLENLIVVKLLRNPPSSYNTKLHYHVQKDPPLVLRHWTLSASQSTSFRNILILISKLKLGPILFNSPAKFCIHSSKFHACYLADFGSGNGVHSYSGCALFKFWPDIVYSRWVCLCLLSLFSTCRVEPRLGNCHFPLNSYQFIIDPTIRWHVVWALTTL